MACARVNSSGRLQCFRSRFVLPPIAIRPPSSAVFSLGQRQRGVPTATAVTAYWARRAGRAASEFDCRRRTLNIPRRGASRDHSIFTRDRESAWSISACMCNRAMRTGTHIGTRLTSDHVRPRDTRPETNDPTVCGSNWYRRGRCCTERHVHTTTKDTLVGDRSGSAQAKSITTRPSVQLAPARVRVRFRRDDGA